LKFFFFGGWWYFVSLQPSQLKPPNISKPQQVRPRCTGSPGAEADPEEIPEGEDEDDAWCGEEGGESEAEGACEPDPEVDLDVEAEAQDGDQQK